MAAGRLGGISSSIALAVVLFAARAEATVLIDWTLEQRVARSDLILIGTIAEARTTEVEGRLMTVTDIEVDSVLLGRAQARISVWQRGGRRDGVIEQIVGDAHLRPGQRMLLFTREHTDGRRYLVGMSLGAYLIRGETLWQDVTTPLLRDGELVAPPGQRVLRLREVLDAISEAGR